MRQRGQSKRTEITEAEVTRNQVWTAGYLIQKLGGLVECIFHSDGEPLRPGQYEAEIADVETHADELHPKVIVHLKLKGHD